ncbi:hypothetical protein [Streptomyces sp. SID13031]|uniref:hypothetical protein n=1 Tax=Streptomyces sp. SID13031 TaxID=2706046 RepID=UPI0013C7C327|nr:hypothetical protein [Streptomyces sp. SID13031]NEA37464.1 hypothetical protein [Streptomyces sp. SID13031]
MLGADRTLTAFARVLAGPGRPAVAASTISRWESGAVAVGYGAVRRYEVVLGLPRNGLVAVIDTVNRHWSNTIVSAPALIRRVRTDAVDDLLDRACSGAIMRGSDWDRLTYALTSNGQATYLPRSLWAQLSDRLLAELQLADGLRWHERYEAMGRLLAYAGSRPAAIDSCVQAALDSRNQMAIEAVSALDGSDHHDASAAVLRQLERPTNSGAQAGALLASVRKIRAGHFGPDQRQRIAIVLHDLRDCPDSAGTIRLGRAILRDTSRARALPVRAQLKHSSFDHERRTVILRRVMTRIQAPLEVPAEDVILTQLVSEMLFSLCPGSRLSAASTIAASPYRASAAAAVAAELRHPSGLRLGWATALLDALRIVGGSAERRLVERLTVSPEIPEPLAATAAYSFCHLGGRTPDEFWASAIAAQTVHRSSAPRVAVLRGLVYSAGMTGTAPVLARLREDPTSPAVRTAAGWWLDLPASILSSARQ